MIADFQTTKGRQILRNWLDSLPENSQTVFTNGCFDLIHTGHLRYLRTAKAAGTHLILGINSDQSVRENKGQGRPYVAELERAELLEALDAVDAVVIFSEITPEKLITFITPTILAKGAEYRRDQIIGADHVEKNGGQVLRVVMEDGFSTTALLEKIRQDIPEVPKEISGVVAVIPARYDSSRLPGKPLLDIAGKPMIQWVVESVQQAQKIDQVIVATDDQRIFDAVTNFGGQVVMTSPDCRSGTDRVMEVALSTPGDLFVNVQGDEPLIAHQMLDQLVSCIEEQPQLDIVTAAVAFTDETLFNDPNCVKVVTGSHDRALYFSRSPIPFDRDQPFAGANRHIGVYLYRRKALMDMARLETSTLEEREKLEQLRALEAGMKMAVVMTEDNSPGVDTMDDLIKVRGLMEEKR